jgi:Cu+-exporting ATPase
MVGDGLNDAGALKQSDVGLAVVEEVGAFSPASDGIIAATTVPQLAALLQYAQSVVRVVKAGLAISAAYNLVGLALAVQGLLSPVFCAVFMPLSSITVVLFSSGMATWLARRILPLPGGRGR